mgnify:CR=1 FL=1
MCGILGKVFTGSSVIDSNRFKEALNLIDNLERSKLILESDEVLKGTEALKKTLEHFDIINKDLISIFTKNS